MLKKNLDWRRRILTTSIWFLSAVFLTMTLWFWLVLGFILDTMTPKKSAYMRTAIFFWSFFLIEIRGLFLIGLVWLFRSTLFRDDAVYNRMNRKVQRHWASALFWVAAKIYSVDVHVDGIEALDDEVPAILLSRHASTLDTMVPLALTWKRKLKDMRYVLKAELLMDPCLDFGAQRLPNYFVRRGSNAKREISGILALTKDLPKDGVVVVYPEGTRFSKKKRTKLIRRLEEKGSPLLEIADVLENTLPPVRDGVIKLLETTADEDVIFVAHRGMGQTESMASLFSGSLLRQRIDVKLWRVRAKDVPRTEQEIRNFLISNWKGIDRFVESGTLELPVEPLRAA